MAEWVGSTFAVVLAWGNRGTLEHLRYSPSNTIPQADRGGECKVSAELLKYSGTRHKKYICFYFTIIYLLKFFVKINLTVKVTENR